jgi:hypothetical protein
MEYKTHVFEEKKRSYGYDISFYVTIIVLVSASIFGIYYFGPKSLFFSAGAFVFTLFKQREEDREQAGMSLYGKRKSDLIIYEDRLEVQGKIIPFAEVTNLTIYVDEFTGMSKDILWSYHGGNNEICFDYRDKHYSFNYIIRNKKDFLHVEKLVELIEYKYPIK